MSKFQRSPLATATPATQDKQPALFHSVRAALAFAFTISEFPIASSPQLTPPMGASGRLSSLTAHEKHAQGALIRRKVQGSLHGPELAVTLAYYGSGAMRRAAIHEVGKEVAKVVRKRAVAMELTKRHFATVNTRRSQQDIADEYGISQQTVSRLDRIAGDEIERLRKLTEERLEQLFVATGIAEGV